MHLIHSLGIGYRLSSGSTQLVTIGKLFTWAVCPCGILESARSKVGGAIYRFVNLSHRAAPELIMLKCQRACLLRRKSAPDLPD